jgi:AcrR family transcriptional regulator
MKDAGRGGRKPRADALRNREKLMTAAKAAFTEAGAEVSLEEIARRAGVGIGTLYRHFPTREPLLEAVYRREVEQLAAAAERLVDDLPPAEALRQWMRLFADYLAPKKVIAPALAAMAGGHSELFATSSKLIRGAVELLLERAIAAGALRDDVEVDDIIQALAGVAYNVASPGWRERAYRLIDIVVAGLQAPAAPDR